jgi:hypothetical protein
VTLVLARQWRAPASFGALVESCCCVSAAFFMLLVTMLLPWHLLTVVVLAVLAGREPFVMAGVTLTLLALLSYLVTFAVATLMLLLPLSSIALLRWARSPQRRTATARAGQARRVSG